MVKEEVGNWTEEGAENERSDLATSRGQFGVGRCSTYLFSKLFS